MKFYQPMPFKGYENTDSSRTLFDCEGRYQAIKKDYGDIKDKTLIDLCCANGFFGWRFLQDGGKSVVGIEKESDVRLFINIFAEERGLNFVCKEKPDKSDSADIGIYLDTHYHEGTTGYLDYLVSRVKVLYTSSSRDNAEYRYLLRSYFKNVSSLYDEKYANREMFKCF